ncbi:50S ribosomal protein L13 [Candidatus Uhrbacteria bacterium]|jgi:large subunit ribosomal protein L13|nr:50S ribosomal protein L13 [Candidatus Woesearchaeota archaeon]MBT6254366.1 50S ribosomal protein L13 [Candidatus Uhrbacteria bacterium]
MEAITRTTHTIDAAGRSPGRIAAEISHILQGKDRPDYKPHIDMGGIVNVENAGEMKITGDKMDGKIYYRHSGHPGGLKEETLRKVWDKDPTEVLKRAVLRMLPKNRLRTERMKRMTIKK